MAWLCVAAFVVLCFASGPARAANTFEKVLAVGGQKAAWGDYDNDGWVDLCTGVQLWHNDKGKLTLVEGVVLNEGIWGDYDNDGYLDYFSYTTQILYHNVGGTHFDRVPLPALGMVSLGACWGDFNGDGYLDLYVGGFESWPTSYFPDKILTNNRDGTFSLTWTQGNDTLTTPGRPRPARGVAAADWDRDGDLDIYVSNYRLEPNALWRNDGHGNFTDVAGTHNALATSEGFFGGHSIGAVWGDFDNDGLLDLFAGNFAHEGQPQSRFLRNKGAAADYAFEDRGTGGVFYQESYASPTAGDIDNDGDLDLYCTTVYADASGGLHNYPILFRNDGNFNFVDVTTDWGLPKTGAIATYQAAFADYDHDGYLDLVTDGKLYHNTGGTNHWLKVQLKPESVGAQVLIDRGGKKLLRQVESAVGEGNQNDPMLHFGLGGYQGPVRLEIRWPGGKVQRVAVSKVDQTVTVNQTAPRRR